jgi:hypothetical protein
MRRIVVCLALFLVAAAASAQTINMPRRVTTNYVGITLEGTAAQNMIVLVNSTNFGSATWGAYTTNFSLNLGSGDGWRDVSFAFQSASGAVSYQTRRVLVDTSALALFLTDTPLTNASPRVQINGFTTRPIVNLSCTVSNSAGTNSDVLALVVDSHFDKDIWAPSTNYFRCYDLLLAPGANTVTLTYEETPGTPLASTFTLWLDTSLLTNAPTMTIEWPPATSARIGADSLAIIGQVQDTSLSIVAVVQDESGLINEYEAVVERNGRFWIEDIALTGTNHTVTVTATDAANNSTTNTLTISRSAVTLTIAEVAEDELWNRTTTVSGTISVSDHAVWVNGAQADLDGMGGGTAMFAVTAIPNADNGGNGTPPSAAYPANSAQLPANANPASTNATISSYQPEKKEKIVFEWFYWSVNGTLQAIGPELNLTGSYSYLDLWRIDQGGTHSMTGYVAGLAYGNPNFSSPSWSSGSWPSNNSGTWISQSIPFANAYEPFWREPPRFQMYQGFSTYDETPSIYGEGTDKSSKSFIGIGRTFLYTGGKSTFRRNNLFTLSGSAKQPWQSIFGQDASIPSTALAVGFLGRLYSDAKRYVILPDNDRFEVTIFADQTIPGRYTNYSYEVSATKHKLLIQANSYLLSQDRIRPNAFYCVGQQLIFTYAFSPAVEGIVENQTLYDWILTPTFVNIFRLTSPYAINETTDAPDFADPWEGLFDMSLMSQPQCKVWYLRANTSGHQSTNNAKLTLTLTMSNGQQVRPLGKGQFGMYQPRVASFTPDPVPPLPQVQPTTPDPTLALGNAAGSGAMTWNLMLAHPQRARFGQEAYYTQLIKRHSTWNAYLAPWLTLTDSTSGDFWLDNYYIYGGAGTYGSDPVPFSDQPSRVGIETFVEINDSMKAYLRFKPSGSTSIPVTLGLVTWGWHARAELIGGAWGLAASPAPSVSPLVSDWSIMAFPKWQRVYTNTP